MGFLNSFLSYLILVLIFICVAGIGSAVGICLRKRKDRQAVGVSEKKR